MQAMLNNIPCGFKKIDLPLPSQIYQRYQDTKEDTFVVKFAKPFFLCLRRQTKARLTRVLLTTINGKRLLLIYAHNKKQGGSRQTRIGYCLQLSTAIGINIARKSMKSAISDYIDQGELHCLIEIKFKFGTTIFELDGEKRLSEWCARILKSYEPALLPETPKRQLMIQQGQMEMVEHYSSSPVQQSTSAKLSTSTAVQNEEEEEISEDEEESKRTKEGWSTLNELNMTTTDNEEEEERHSAEEDDIYENLSQLFKNSTMTSASSMHSSTLVSHSKKKHNHNEKKGHHQHGRHRNAEKRQNVKKNKKQAKHTFNSDQQQSSSDIGSPLASSSFAEPSSVTGTTEISDSSTQNGRRRFKWTPNRERRQTIMIYNSKGGGGESMVNDDRQQQSQATLSQGYSRLMNSPREQVNEHLCHPMPAALPVQMKKQVRWHSSSTEPKQFVPRPIIPMQQTNSTYGYIVQRYGFSTSNSMDNSEGLPSLDQFNNYRPGTINDQMLNVKRLFEERINKFLKEKRHASSTSSTLKKLQPKCQPTTRLKYTTFPPSSSCCSSPATQLNARGCGLERPDQNQASESNV